jgi:hypothetical protein
MAASIIFRRRSTAAAIQAASRGSLAVWFPARWFRPQLVLAANVSNDASKVRDEVGGAEILPVKLLEFRIDLRLILENLGRTFRVRECHGMSFSERTNHPRQFAFHQISRELAPDSLLIACRKQHPGLGGSVFDGISIDMIALGAFEAPQVKARPVRLDPP